MTVDDTLHAPVEESIFVSRYITNHHHHVKNIAAKNATKKKPHTSTLIKDKMRNHIDPKMSKSTRHRSTRECYVWTRRKTAAMPSVERETIHEIGNYCDNKLSVNATVREGKENYPQVPRRSARLYFFLCLLLKLKELKIHLQP
ncbi:hypothetical protein C4D60_Mb07t13090 [Musa balbisiana]|uniref:Uncharacterized protein n=1 Tax=Musa balbisiana TaxID=52838 RepID=A0A4S8JF66_MUSBA|nr:hypothetical protein C4D60_Mb07t13090 [Musa balbisiana]